MPLVGRAHYILKKTMTQSMTAGHEGDAGYDFASLMPENCQRAEVGKKFR
ncbi:MAG: hypothetical protein JWQ00_1117 [Noviherbaspirillum sp.]|jgi:hypothetical protein|nr:hypothetical protein [Noviherbaspirillum sp.]